MNRWRGIAGWGAVAFSTLLSSLWAFWGSIENFHEGWYFPDLYRNLQLALVQYLPWMLLPMLGAVLGLWRGWVGAFVHGLFAAVALRLFGPRSAGGVLLALPMLLLAGLYLVGRPRPLRWARRTVIGLPLLVALASGAYPGWRAITRPRAVELDASRLNANGVDRVWAPAGPGWPDEGLTWDAARERCARLRADGLSLADSLVGVWRLPTVDEAVRSMVYRGANAGGTWDAGQRRATYRTRPDKDAPLWNRYTKVIYWWTADEVDSTSAYRVTYAGQVYATEKRWGAAYLSCRCTRDAHPAD